MSIFNIVINKYSIFVRKKVTLMQNLMCLLFPSGCKEPKITLTYLINEFIRNLITLIPRVFLFMDEGEHLILVLLCKANLAR